MAESELQKLLIHKVQNLFDPISELPRCEGLSKQRLLKEKPSIEGEHLSAYIITVLSRIMVDFSRFADLVLRWQQNGKPLERRPRRPATANQLGEPLDWDCQSILDRLERQDQQNTELEMKRPGLKRGGKPSKNGKTDGKSKIRWPRCSKTLSELRTRTRLFLRERSLFRQRLKMIHAHALKVSLGLRSRSGLKPLKT